MYSALGGRVQYSRSRDDDKRRGHHGRLGIYYGRDLDRAVDGKVNVEYHTWDPVYALGADIEFWPDEEPVKLSFSFWPFSLYLSFDTPLAKRIARNVTKASWDGEREIALHISSRDEWDVVAWSLWHPIHSWSSTTPKWRNGRWHLMDAMLGRREMRWEPIETVAVSIPMPEGAYDATVEMRDHVSWRKRLPFWTSRLRCARVEIPGGIAEPGKGENAWDIDDDAMLSMSCPAQSVEDAIGKAVASVLSRRYRYGGRRWQPAGRSA